MSGAGKERNIEELYSMTPPELLRHVDRMLYHLRKVSVGLGEERLAHLILLAEVEAKNRATRVK